MHATGRSQQRYVPHSSKLGNFHLRQLVRQLPRGHTPFMDVLPTHNDGFFWNSPSTQPSMLCVHAFLPGPRIGTSSLHSPPASPAISQAHTTLPLPFCTPGEEARRSRGCARITCTGSDGCYRPSDSLSSLLLPTTAQQAELALGYSTQLHPARTTSS